jgi:thioesterase domain-containing protein
LATQMILEIEQIVGHPVNQSALFEASTVRKLAQSLGQQAELHGSCVIHLHAAGDRCPFFYFHGGLGVAHYLRRLSQHLGADQPILAIEPHGLQGELIPASIEEMAVDRVKVILEMQPQGPYCLGGFCNGALVAIETARLLMAEGHKIEMLVLIDPPSVNTRAVPQKILSLVRPLSDRAATSAWRWMSRIEKLSIMSSRQRWAFLQTELVARVQSWRMGGRTVSVPSELPFAADGSSDIVTRYAAVMARYRPRPLAVAVIFYSAAYDGRGWRGPFPDLQIVRIPGGHTECVTDHVADLANHLRGKLGEVGRAAP